MTNLITAIILSLSTNVHHWDDGAQHPIREWHFDHYREVGHATKGYDFIEVRTNIILRGVLDGATNEVTLSSSPVSFQKIEWQTVETRSYITNKVEPAQPGDFIADWGDGPRLFQMNSLGGSATNYLYLPMASITNTIVTNASPSGILPPRKYLK